MTEKTAAEKMRLKPGMTAALLHVPEQMGERLGIPEGVTVTADPTSAEFILDFASNQIEAEERLRALAPLLGPGTITWMAYPKGSKAKGHDVSRDTIWQYAGTIGLVLNANIAIDDVWSAVRMRPV